MFSEKLFLPQVPQPMDSEKGRPLSKLPPVAMQCAWSTITRETGKCRPSASARSGRALCKPTEWPAPWKAYRRSTVAMAAAKSATP